MPVRQGDLRTLGRPDRLGGVPLQPLPTPRGKRVFDQRRGARIPDERFGRTRHLRRMGRQGRSGLRASPFLQHVWVADLVRDHPQRGHHRRESRNAGRHIQRQPFGRSVVHRQTRLGEPPRHGRIDGTRIVLNVNLRCSAPPAFRRTSPHSHDDQRSRIFVRGSCVRTRQARPNQDRAPCAIRSSTLERP